MKRGVVIVFIVIAVVILGGFFIFSQKSDSGERDVSNQLSNEILIQNFAFSPSVLNIKVGEEVIWKNVDTAPHTIVSDSGSEINSNSLAKGESYTHTFLVAGTYDYHCGIHSSMKGKVIVS